MSRRRQLRQGRFTASRCDYRPRRNPPGEVVIGNEVLLILYRKGQAHACDDECAAADHMYVHEFEKGPPAKFIGLPNGSLEIR